MNNSWNWAGRYVAVIVVTLVLAAALGSMGLFEKTTVFSGRLSASHLVRFLGYAAALVAFWLLGQRATIVVRQQHGRWSFLQHLILPVVSLVFLAAAYSVVLLLLKPFMDAALHNFYNWFFIIAILAAAAWLVMAVLNQSAPLTAAFTSSVSEKVCPACGAECDSEAKFCKSCGRDLTAV
jgi:hypothetical protein